jgi:hypothetical protein
VNTGFSEPDAAAVFARERRRHALAKLASRLRGKRGDALAMLSFDDVVAALGRVAEHDLGVQTVALKSIVGTVNRRSAEFDRSFRPRSRRLQARWQRIAAARQRGETMPPIDVYRIGELHFVEDGHHRVSVARALGDATIEARVREVQTRMAAPNELRPSDLWLTQHEREFYERVPLAPAAAARIELVEGWRYEQLGTHVESWAFDASQTHGRLLSRHQAAQAWFREEYEPIADFLEETGFGGPGTQTTRYLRIVKLRNLVAHNRDWSDDVINDLVQATRKRPSDQDDERLHRILKELHRRHPDIGAPEVMRRRSQHAAALDRKRPLSAADASIALRKCS